MLHLISGRRGSGKTAFLYDDIFARGAGGAQKLCLLLPEQATFLHEKQIEQRRGERVLWDFEISSFRRLAERQLFQPLLDALGKQLFVYKILRRRREDFRSFAMSDVRGGFIDSAAAILDEACACGLTVQKLTARAEQLAARENAGDLPQKLWDIAILLEEAEAGTLGVNIHESQLLLEFDRKLREERLFADTVFYLDDFSDFTALEYRLIGTLLRGGAEMYITLLADPEEPLLAKSAAARATLQALCAEAGVGFRERVLPPRPVDCPALAHLERCYGRTLPRPFREPSSELTLLCAEDPAAETEAVARRICALREQGFDPGEIGLVFRDVSQYETHIREIFPRYHIDFYLDSPQPMHSSAVFAYAADFLRLFTEKWSFAAMMSLLKSGLSPLDDDECDSFENYCLAHAIKGRRFRQEEDWPYADEEEDVAAVNATRRRLRELLLPFEQRLKEARLVAEYAAVLWDFVTAGDVSARLNDWKRRERAEGRLLKSAELAGGLDALCELLEQMVVAFPTEEFDYADFCELFTMGARTLRLRTIPPALHQVEISVLGSSRPDRKRAVLLCGVNEGMFPAVSGEGGFLNMNDRELLAAESFWPRGKEYFFAAEDMLTYQALTMATEQLCVSYHRQGGDGAAAQPSLIVYRLRQLFPALAETEVFSEGGHAADDELFWSADKVLVSLPLLLREGGEDSPWQAVPPLFDDTPLAARRDRVLAARDYSGQSKPLSAASCHRYLPGDLYLNVSSLDTYHRCAFSYFAKYGLRLKERKELVFREPDLGIFFHEALRLLMERLRERDLGFAALGEHGHALAGEIAAELLPSFGQDNLFSEEQLTFMVQRLAENLCFIVDVMAERVARGDRFTPVQWEASFGPGRELNGVEIRLEQGNVILTGQIDRIDEATDGDSRFFRVIDYKSGNRDLRLDELLYGMKLQLLIYMLVVENDVRARGGEIEPAGIFYFSLRDLLIKDGGGMDDDELQKQLNAGTAMKGYWIGDEAVHALYGENAEKKQLSSTEHDALLRHLRQMIAAAAGEIYAGVTEIRPYRYGNERSCRFCAFESLCGYDPLLMGGERRFYPLNDKDVRAKFPMTGGGSDATDR